MTSNISQLIFERAVAYVAKKEHKHTQNGYSLTSAVGDLWLGQDLNSPKLLNSLETIDIDGEQVEAIAAGDYYLVYREGLHPYQFLYLYDPARGEYSQPIITTTSLGELLTSWQPYVEVEYSDELNAAWLCVSFLVLSLHNLNKLASVHKYQLDFEPLFMTESGEIMVRVTRA